MHTVVRMKTLIMETAIGARVSPVGISNTIDEQETLINKSIALILAGKIY